MKCAEFQEILPEIIDREAAGEHAAHLQTCTSCSELVSDLKAISEEAMRLGPTGEPSPRVWANIQRALEEEGLIRPERQPGVALVPKPRRSSPFRWLVPATAALALVGAVMVYNARQPSKGQPFDLAKTTSKPPEPRPAADIDDEQLLAEVAAPMRAEYASGLKSVNQSIRDAQQDLDQNPEDDDARHFLMDAYEQRETVYELAMARSMP